MLFEHLALALIKGRQACQGLVQLGEDGEVRFLDPQRFIEFDSTAAAPAFGGLPGARMVNQQLAHHTGCDGQEVRTVLESGLSRVNQLEIGLMDKGRRVQASIRDLATEAAASQPAEPVVNEGNKTVQRPGVAITPLLEQTRDVGGNGFDHALPGLRNLDVTLAGANIAAPSTATNPLFAPSPRCIAADETLV